jgi:hypothetical protein
LLSGYFELLDKFIPRILKNWEKFASQNYSKFLIFDTLRGFFVLSYKKASKITIPTFLFQH